MARELGRATLLRTAADVQAMKPRRRGPLGQLDSNPQLLDELVALIARHAESAAVGTSTRHVSRGMLDVDAGDPRIRGARWSSDRR